MIKSIIKRQFNCDRNKLWEVITSNNNHSWRSDLSKIYIIDQKHFIEYDKNNFPTYFTITKKEKLKEYKFDLENTNLKGKWTGLFVELDNENIELTFIEEIEVNSFIMKIFAKSYLKRQQKRYMKDLEIELSNLKER
ncbi:MAG: polyketide cyclase [Clostridia bacterium]